MIKKKDFATEFGIFTYQPINIQYPMERHLQVRCGFSNWKERLVYNSINEFRYLDTMRSTGFYPMFIATVIFTLTTDGEITTNELYELDKQAIDIINQHGAKSNNQHIQNVDYPKLEERESDYKMVIADHLKHQLPILE